MWEWPKSCTSDTDGEELPDPELYSHVNDETSSTDDFNNNLKVHDAIIYVQDAMPQSCINTESGEVHIVVDPTPSSVHVSEGSHHDVLGNFPENTQSVIVHKAPEMDCLLDAEKDELEISQNILFSNSTSTCMSEKEEGIVHVIRPDPDEKQCPIMKAVQNCVT